jgi:hypothetical protein
MKTRTGESVTPKTSNKAMVSAPNSLYSSKVFGKDLEIESNYVDNSSTTFAQMWNQQHPLIHTWLILSSVSICFLSALLFIIH